MKGLTAHFSQYPHLSISVRTVGLRALESR
jgi:hypothetical protein